MRSLQFLLTVSISMCGVAAQTTGTWTRQIPQSFPEPRSSAVSEYDPVRHQVVLFGGEDGNYLNDTWVWDGNNWTRKSPLTSPPGRTGAAMAFDGVRNQIILFGGFGTSGWFADTWSWDGTNWTQLQTPVSPSPRDGHAMVYDAARKQIVLFGGTVHVGPGVSQSLNDVWTWNGSTWSQLFPQNSPPGRSRHTMAYDSTRSQVVVFGGFTQALADDTWVWNGSNWTQKITATSPPARSSATLSDDAAAAELVLFGGIAADPQSASGTWAWDGTNWTLLKTATEPNPRISATMSYDAAHSQVVLFGGGNYFSDGPRLGDTWAFSGASPVSRPVISALINASGFGGGSTVAPGSWVEIYGTALASTTRQWSGADFNGTAAPTALDGVQVTIGGQKAFVDYVSSSPGQINAQLPSNIAVGGMLPVTVTNGTSSSAAFNVQVNSVAPGLLAPASFIVRGNQYVAALLSDGVTYVLPTGAIAGVPSRPVHPGETMVTYGIGFGAVTPDIPAGQIATVANTLNLPLQILFGQTQAAVTYKGLSPGFVGLYQFNVVVPPVPDNDLTPLTFVLGGVTGGQKLYIAVRQ